MAEKKSAQVELAQREAERDLGQEILEGLQDIKVGKTGRRFTAASFPVMRAREKSGLSQSRFAELLGVSVRTLQEWEQGRREPSGAAKTLLKIAERYPEVLQDVAA